VRGWQLPVTHGTSCVAAACGSVLWYIRCTAVSGQVQCDKNKLLTTASASVSGGLEILSFSVVVVCCCCNCKLQHGAVCGAAICVWCAVGCNRVHISRRLRKVQEPNVDHVTLKAKQWVGVWVNHKCSSVRRSCLLCHSCSGCCCWNHAAGMLLNYFCTFHIKCSNQCVCVPYKLWA
jgi:hypothetical protein